MEVFNICIRGGSLYCPIAEAPIAVQVAEVPIAVQVAEARTWAHFFCLLQIVFHLLLYIPQ